MSSTKLEIGEPIDSWCTHCKADHAHTVATLKTDGTLNKVQCTACEAIHVYRKPKTAPDTPKKTGESKRRKRPDAAVTDAEAQKAKPYAMDGAFVAGDVLEHAKFGYGRVISVKPGGKMEVAFPDGNRVMVCRDQGLIGQKRAARAAIRVVEAAEIIEPVAVDAEEAEVEADDTAAAGEEE